MGLILALVSNIPAATPFAPATTNGPRITCDQPVYDFGTTNIETYIHHTFTLNNNGNAPLSIQRIRAACGCITAALPTNPIPPGQSFPLTTIMALRGHSGSVRKVVIIESNDPQQPQYQLEFTGTLALDIDIQPQIISFGPRMLNESAERSATIVAASGVTFQVTGLKIDSPAFSGAVTTNVAGKQYQLSVRAHPAKAGGHSDAIVNIFTDNPKYPVLTVSLTQYISADIVVVPRKLILYLQESDLAPPRHVTVASRSNKPFAVTAVELPSPEMSAQINPEGPARYQIEIKGGTISEALNGKFVVIKTDRTGMDPLSVPISVRPMP